jgi:TolB-like protein/tetratricopeptide (TPR) repeat protein
MGTRTHFSPEYQDEGFRNSRRQRLYKVTAAYAVAAWLAIQVADVMTAVFSLPDWSVRLVLTIALLGWPVALTVAWIRDGHAASPEFAQPGTSLGGRMIDFVVIAVLIGTVGGLLAFDPGSNGLADRRIGSIAVMPFRDLSEQKVREYLGDGIAGELLNNLTRVDGLRVAARTSSFAFRDSDTDIGEIGRYLDVDAIVEGSLRVSGQQIRITVQLIDARDGFNIWSQTYSRRMDDILSLQEEIGTSIVDALRLEVLGDRGDGRPTLSAAAYQRYLEGRFEFHRRTPASLSRAADLFREAIDLDPGYALAYTGLADTGLLLVGYGNLSPAEGQSIAEDAISRALALDNQLAEAYASLGLLRYQSGEPDAAEQAYRHAIELNPDYSMAQMWLGNLLIDSGRLQESLRMYERACLTDPLHPVINANFASALFVAGRYEEGMKVLRDAAEVSPESDALKRQLAAWSGKYGRVDEAMAYAREAVAIDPQSPGNLLAMSIAAEGIGNTEVAEAWQERAEVVAPDNYTVVWRRAELLLQTGRMVALDGYASSRLESNPIPDDGPLTEADRMHLTWAGIAKIHLHDYDEGIAYLERALGDASAQWTRFQIPTMTRLVIAYRKSARDEEAEAILNKCWAIVEDMRQQGFDDPGFRVLIAGLYAVDGEIGEAISSLETAAAQGWKNYGTMENGLEFDRLRRDDRFRGLMQRLRTQVSVLREKDHVATGGRPSVDDGARADSGRANALPGTQALVRRRDVRATNPEAR